MLAPDSRSLPRRRVNVFRAFGLLVLVVISGCSKPAAEMATASLGTAGEEFSSPEESGSTQLSQPAEVRAEVNPPTPISPPRLRDTVVMAPPQSIPKIQRSPLPRLDRRMPQRNPVALEMQVTQFDVREVLPMEIETAETFAVEAAPRNRPMAMSIDRHAAATDEELFSRLPAGAARTDLGFATVQVYYATDRMRGPVPLSSYEVTGQKRAFMMLGGASMLSLCFAVLVWFLGRAKLGAMSATIGCVAGGLAGATVLLGQASIEKHGVTYSGGRGSLTRGVCEVTVPDSHQRGMVERPSLLRFEFKENQREHVVLRSAVELSETDFKQRLSQTVRDSPEADLLVFIHGYNVSFESAVQRTAQIAVDLPFEGVPVCYSWPSQASLVGYPIDETNAAWTTTHLKQFLMELVNESGARSINVVAHSMGNRPMTAAMEQIRWQHDEELATPFDRIVLAAPDVDADRFRRDLAPSLLQVAQQVTLYASSDDQALIASKQVHGYPRAGESGVNVVVVPGVETIDVSGLDLSLLGHSYYGNNESMLRDLYQVVRTRLRAPDRNTLIPLRQGDLTYWQFARRTTAPLVR